MNFYGHVIRILPQSAGTIQANGREGGLNQIANICEWKDWLRKCGHFGIASMLPVKKCFVLLYKIKQIRVNLNYKNKIINVEL